MALELVGVAAWAIVKWIEPVFSVIQKDPREQPEDDQCEYSVVCVHYNSTTLFFR
jgi:hypothetical protein